MSKFLCYIYPSSLPNLARLRTEKFLVLPTKSWNDTNTCSKFTIFLDDKIRATVQLITYTVPQNCLSIFTIHHNSQFTFRFSSEAELQIFVLEGRHLSKIQLGANVTRKIYLYLSFVWCRVLFLSSCLLSWRCLIKVNHLFTLSYPHLFQLLV